MATRLALRRDKTVNWTEANPVLAMGEPGYDEDNNDFKIGDGLTAWLDLPTIAMEGPRGPQGATGDVTPAAEQAVVDAQAASALAQEAATNAASTAAAIPTQVASYLVANPPSTSGPDIIWNGDSLSAMGGGLTPPVNPAAYLSAYLGQTVLTNAVGGEKSSGIAARQGGEPYLMLPTGGSIPASGGVTVTFTTPSGDVQYPLLQPNGNPALGSTFVGYIHTPDGDISGTLTLTQPSGASTSHQSDDYYTFTRTTAGSVVYVNRPAPFYLDFALAHQGGLHILQLGRNDVAISIASQSVADCVAQITGRIAACVEFLRAANLRYIIVGVHNGTGTAAFTAGTATVEGSGSDVYLKVTAVNKALANTYGRRFVNYRTYLINYGLADEGITPTANDTADIAADTVPRSLLLDGLHFLLPTRQIVGQMVGDRMVELGWATKAGSAPTVPGQPSALVATAGDSSASLTWVAPTNGGSPITDYVIEYELATGGTWTPFAHTASPATSATVTGLTNGAAYNFRVSAKNAIGTGAVSATATCTPVAAWVISDDFNRADSSTLGALWDTQTNFSIASNKLTPSDTASTVDVSLLTGPAPSPDHKISADITRGGSTSVGLVLRAVDTTNFFGCRINLATGNILIYKVIAGVTTSLSGADGLWTTDGSTLTFAVKAHTFTAYVNGVSVLTTTATDATLDSAVKAGVRAASNASKPTYDNLVWELS